MTDDELPVVERGLLATSDAAWDQAVRQAAVIAPLAALEVVGYGAADEAAALLGVSRRQVYVLIGRYRRSSGRVTDLVPAGSGGGRGGGRLPAPVEAVIDGLIRKRYLKRQQLSLAVVHRDIVRACSEQGFPVPARSTVARRIAALHPATVARRREGADAARPLQAAGGIVPEISAPLEQVQIDHTVTWSSWTSATGSRSAART
jgi:putative transposase